MGEDIGSLGRASSELATLDDKVATHGTWALEAEGACYKDMDDNLLTPTMEHHLALSFG